MPAEPDSTEIDLIIETEPPPPVDRKLVEQVTHFVAKHEEASFRYLEILFVDEERIIDLNKTHLDKVYVTDTLSFRYDDHPDNNSIEGSIVLCSPRIYEQSEEYGQDPGTEFRRVLVHALLHLAGYEDNAPEKKKKMHEREDFYLEKLAGN